MMWMTDYVSNELFVLAKISENRMIVAMVDIAWVWQNITRLAQLEIDTLQAETKGTITNLWIYAFLEMEEATVSQPQIHKYIKMKNYLSNKGSLKLSLG